MWLFYAVLIWSVLLMSAAGSGAQESAAPLPEVIQHAEPKYPPITRT
jgi:hypothetical protein